MHDANSCVLGVKTAKIRYARRIGGFILEFLLVFVKTAIISPLDANGACIKVIRVFLGSKLPKLGRRLFFGAFILEFLSIFVKNAMIRPLDATGACMMPIPVFLG